MIKDTSGRHLEVLARVGQSLLGAIDLEDQLAFTLRLAVDALGAERGSVMLVDSSLRNLRVAAAEGLPAEAMESTTPFGEGIAGWVAEHMEPVVLHGGVVDGRFEGIDPSIESSISLPLQVQETLLGVLNLVRKSGDRFQDEDLRLASSLGGLASIAIEKAQLLSALKERESRVSELLAATIGAQERERTRIAGDIHDGFLQDLSALYLKVENMRGAKEDSTSKMIDDAQQMIRNQMAALRDYIFEVRPPSLDQVGLAPTLKAMVDRTSATAAIGGHFKDDSGGRRLPETIETIVYRTAQEALRNTVKHSRAKNVWVTLAAGPNAELLVSDDGTSIDPEVVSKRSTRHFGIASMRERVELAGGIFEIGPREPKGTTVRAVIPLEA